MKTPPAGSASVPPGDRRTRERRASGQVAMPIAPRPHLMRGLGLYAALFGGVLLLLLVAVVLEDMALRDSLRIQAERDADAVVTELESSVTLRVAAGRAFTGLDAVDLVGTADSGSPARSDKIARLIGAVTSPPLFEHIAIVDRVRGVVFDTVLSTTVRAPVANRRLLARTTIDELIAMSSAASTAASGAARDTIGIRDTAAASPLPRPRVEHLGERGDVVAIVVPLTGDSAGALTFVGIANGRDLIERSINEADPRRLRLVIQAGEDTVLHDGDVSAAGLRVATSYARIGAPQVLRVDVLHEDTAPGVRATLWLLGGAAVLFLVLGLARERRQADHVAERSAELERLSTELLRSNRMKSEFLANVSHELRTPLNAIVGFVELLRDGVYGELSPRQTNPVERIAGSATHLRHLVDQVLDIAKMAAGRLEVHLESVVLRPFVLNVASELESLAADKGIVLSLTVGSSLPRVRTDPSHLRQILVNLVGNAIKYTPSGGAVAIRTRLVGGPDGVAWRGPTPAAGSMALPVNAGLAPPPGAEEEPVPSTLAARSPDPARSWVAVQVSDTGIGIAPTDHDRIFEEFEQINSGPRSDSMERGTGLGLPISRRLARLLGGDVSVESGLGKGATFTLWLPLEAASSR